MNKKLIHYSLFLGLIGIATDAAAVIRVGNATRNYAQSYNQVNQLNQQNELSDADMARVAGIPAPAGAGMVNVPGQPTVRDEIKDTAPIDTDAVAAANRMARCQAIYPTGEFEWKTPTAGLGAGGATTCTAVIEMRGYQMGPNGSDIVLARVNVAAGDSVVCNISEFPEYSYTQDAYNIEFPADTAPTTDDVVKVMNQEQKKNAGIKIAAGAVLGGIGGNFAGKNAPGQDGVLGTGKDKMQSTLVGALGGAALMAGNSYAGKVGGDVILSTGVNATAGALVGNIAASGESVLRIERCTVDGRETTCLWGQLVESETLALGEETDSNGKTTTKRAFYNIANDSTMVCNDDMSDCHRQELVDIRLIANPKEELSVLASRDWVGIKDNAQMMYQFNDVASYDKSGATNNFSPYTGTGDIWAEISSAGVAKQRQNAMIIDVKDTTFGLKKSDLTKILASKNESSLRARNNRGEAFPLDTEKEYKLSNFKPMYVDAEDGGIIDLSNKARLKTTLIGAGAGGALGAFVGYQGAQKDIDERWVAASREYDDSLQKVYCATGTRFLSFYNSIAEVPPISYE